MFCKWAIYCTPFTAGIDLSQELEISKKTFDRSTYRTSLKLISHYGWLGVIDISKLLMTIYNY